MEPKHNKDLIKEFQKHRKWLGWTLILIITISTIIFLLAKGNPPEQKLEETNQLTINFKRWENLPTLQTGHYTLWLIDNKGTYHFFKRFNTLDDRLVSLNGETLTEWTEVSPETIKAVAITIEREGDRDEKPNSIELFESDTNKEDSVLLKLEIKEPIGEFVLATPTDGNNNINEQSGLWFTNNEKTQGSLSLPDLPSKNWIWQAWLVTNDDKYLNIGRFQDSSNNDDFDKYSNPETDGFNYPGEDFLRDLPEGFIPPLNLSNGNYSVLISIEPLQDGLDISGDQIFLPVLTGKIPKNASTKKAHPLTNIYQSATLELEFVN